MGAALHHGRAQPQKCLFSITKRVESVTTCAIYVCTIFSQSYFSL